MTIRLDPGSLKTCHFLNQEMEVAGGEREGGGLNLINLTFAIMIGEIFRYRPRTDFYYISRNA